jgi:membrane-bound ClpP family serine protease
MRFAISVLLACLLSKPASARGMRQNVIVEQINGKIQNSSKEQIRELWEFDQDDLFLEHTTQGKRYICVV